MNKQKRVSHPIYNLLATDIEGFEFLAELALDMQWSWDHSTDEVWRQLDPELWEITHNPWVVLQTVSREPGSNDMLDRSCLTVRTSMTCWELKRLAAGGAGVVSATSFAKGSLDLRRVFQSWNSC